MEIVYYDSTEEINATIIDKAVKKLVLKEIEKDKDEIEDNEYTVEEVSNDFQFVDMMGALERLKCNLSSTDESLIDWDYEDYENTCT